ncbi:hypothetical protein MCAP1_000970 [Malassezia caprae]|uniref:Uncharacterized protein n=1 Tax=Malassezia caprae TaxID=1381934 RepID=A0AAF0IUG5_9BASI|nr:hypothetical protein MCAP1_000970 [Malassezia caprae]
MTAESVEYVYALYNFDAENPDEVSFRMGERVRVVEKDDAYGDGWYQGTNERGETGLFPFSYTTYDESAAQMMVTGASKSSAAEPAAAEPGVLHSTMNDIDHALSELHSPRTGDWDDENEAEPDFAARAAARAALARNAQKSLAEAAHEQEAGGAWPAASGLGEPGSISSASHVGLSKAPGITPLAMLEMSDESEDEDDAAQALGASTSPVRPPATETSPELPSKTTPAQSVPESPESPFGMTPTGASSGDVQPMQPQSLSVTALALASTAPEPEVTQELPTPTAATSQTVPPPVEASPVVPPPDEASPLVPPPVEASPVVPPPVEASPVRQEVSIPGGFIEPPTPARDSARPRASVPAASPAVPPASAPVVSDSKPAEVTTPPRPATLGSPPSGAPGGDPLTWTVDDVVAWARSKNYDAQTIEKLAEHEISGDALLAMDIHLLKEIDIVAFGRRFHLANGIKELRERASTPPVAPTPMAPTPVSPAPTAPTPVPTSPWNSASGPEWTSPQSYASPVFRDAVPSASPAVPSVASVPGLAPPASWASLHSATPQPWETDVPVPASIPSTAAPQPAEPAPQPTEPEKPRAAAPAAPVQPAPVAASEPVDMPLPAVPSAERESRHRFHLRPVRSKSSARASGPDKSQISLPTSNAHFAPPPAPPKDEARQAAAQGTVLQRIGPVDRQGWIKKRGERYNTWNSRYLVLQGHDLLVLRDPSAERVKSHIPLQGYKVISDESAPGRYSFKIVHDSQRTHQFSLDDPVALRSWMKAVMKSTIGRDTSQSVISSYSNPTISLEEAQRRRPRPPSPSSRHRSQLDLARESAELQVARDMAAYGPGNDLV